MLLIFQKKWKSVMFLRLATLAMFLGACSTPGHDINYGNKELKAEPKIHSKTIVLLHGMFVTPESWGGWKTYLEHEGFTVFVPAWPEHRDTTSKLRSKHPDKALGNLRLSELLGFYRDYIGKLNEKPILVGHSMGGLLAQLLLQEGTAVAAVAIDSAPPKGQLSLRGSFLRSNWPVASPFVDENEPVLLNQDQFAYAFLNCVPEPKHSELYTKYLVPESRHVGKDALSEVARINYDIKALPLLFIAGEEDHIIPPSLNYSNFSNYAKAPSLTEFQLFPGRCHWILGQDKWQEVADYIVKWIQHN
jgi:pimeloyl-ACP methyl ester carboxylesterase